MLGTGVGVTVSVRVGWVAGNEVEMDEGAALGVAVDWKTEGCPVGSNVDGEKED